MKGTQADLNWRNPEVREELADVVNFWLEKGVRGLRFDVINVIGKDEELKNNQINEGKAEYTDTPIVHDYLQELHAATFGKRDGVMTVGEMSERTRMLLTYALCGFANIGSVGITVTGLSVLIPERREEVLGMVWKALFAGFLSTLMTAAVVGAMPASIVR